MTRIPRNMVLSPSMFSSWRTWPRLSLPSSSLRTILAPTNSFGFGILGLDHDIIHYQSIFYWHWLAWFTPCFSWRWRYFFYSSNSRGTRPASSSLRPPGVGVVLPGNFEMFNKLVSIFPMKSQEADSLQFVLPCLRLHSALVLCLRVLKIW